MEDGCVMYVARIAVEREAEVGWLDRAKYAETPQRIYWKIREFRRARTQTCMGPSQARTQHPLVGSSGDGRSGRPISAAGPSLAPRHTAHPPAAAMAMRLLSFRPAPVNTRSAQNILDRDEPAERSRGPGPGPSRAEPHASPPGAP